MARNRIIYGSQAVWCNGEVLYRVQTLGSTTTFTSEDLFELGHMDVVDVVDDVPAVAITLNTNDFGDPKTMAILAQVAATKLDMNDTATSGTGNLLVVSGTGLVSQDVYLHGACLADFAIVCGNLPGVTLWAPVQSECDLGTLADDIDQTLFMDEVFVNSLEFGYTTGANATENYGAEADNKVWLLNDGRFVNWEVYTDTSFSGGTPGEVTLGAEAVVLSDNTPGFLRTDENGVRAVTVFDVSANTMVNYPTRANAASTDDIFSFNLTGDVLQQPDNLTLDTGDKVFVLYASHEYGTVTTNKYFAALSEADDPERSVGIGAVRQGQVEIYIVSDTDTSFENAWRLTGCTITSDLTREPLAELGHLGPYDRPLTIPIPITITIDTTASDLTHWFRFAGRYGEFDTRDDIDLTDLMAEEDLKLIVKVFYQTDEEAGGTGSNRKVLSGSDLEGKGSFNNGEWDASYTANDPERALKTIIVEHIKITDEAYTLDMGTNATQTFGFRSTNDLYVVKGDLSIEHITDGKKVRRNPS